MSGLLKNQRGFLLNPFRFSSSPPPSSSFVGFIALSGGGWGAFELVSESTITRLPTDGATAPNGVQILAVSKDGNIVVTRSLNYPWTDVFKRNGKSFARLPTRPSDPDNTPITMAFSPDGTHFVIGHNSASGINVYQHNAGSFTRIANVTSAPGFTVVAVAYSPDGQHLAVCGPGNIAIYKRSGDSYDRISGAVDVMPTGLGGVHLTYSSDGLLAVGFWGSGTSACWIYERSGDSYTKLPWTAPNGDCRGVTFSPDGSKFAYTDYAYNATVHLLSRTGVGGKTITEVFNAISDTQWAIVEFSPDSQYLLSDAYGANGALFKVGAASLTKLMSSTQVGFEIFKGTWRLFE